MDMLKAMKDIFIAFLYAIDIRIREYDRQWKL